MSPLLLRRMLQVLTGTLAGLAVVAVIVLGVPGRGGGPAPLAVGVDPVVPEPYPAPRLDLRTAGGEPFDLEAVRGEPAVVFFGFTNCPDVCPLTLSNLSRALELLEPSERAFRAVFVSVDPERDTPSVVSRYMERFHPSLTALTGSPADVEAAAEAWGVHVSTSTAGAAPHPGHEGHPPAGPDGGDPGEYTVIHSTRSFVVDREGRVVRTLPAHLTPEEIVAALEPVLSP